MALFFFLGSFLIFHQENWDFTICLIVFVQQPWNSVFALVKFHFYCLSQGTEKGKQQPPSFVLYALSRIQTQDREGRGHCPLTVHRRKQTQKVQEHLMKKKGNSVIGWTCRLTLTTLTNHNTNPQTHTTPLVGYRHCSKHWRHGEQQAGKASAPRKLAVCSASLSVLNDKPGGPVIGTGGCGHVGMPRSPC